MIFIDSKIWQIVDRRQGQEIRWKKIEENKNSGKKNDTLSTDIVTQKNDT